MRGYNYASPGYYGSASASGYYHNSYATIAAALQRQPTASERPHRSNTFSRLPNGYSAGSSGKIISKPSPSTHQAKRSRHRAESGPASSTVSPLQSGVSSPKGKASSESRRELRAAEADSKQSRDDRRRSTVSRHEAPRRRKKGEHEHYQEAPLHQLDQVDKVRRSRRATRSPMAATDYSAASEVNGVLHRAAMRCL